MRRKVLLVLECVIMIFNLCGCGSDVKNEKIAEDTADRIVDMINDRDASGLKSVFSEKAKENAKDIDGEIAELFEWFDGEITRIDKKYVQLGTLYTKDGVTNSVRVDYHLYTTEKHYVLYILHFTSDTADKSNEGVFSIKVSDYDAVQLWQEMHAEKYVYVETETPGVFIFDG